MNQWQRRGKRFCFFFSSFSYDITVFTISFMERQTLLNLKEEIDMAYVFVLAMCAMALLFLASQVIGDVVAWIIQKSMDLIREARANRTNGGASA